MSEAALAHEAATRRAEAEHAAAVAKLEEEAREAAAKSAAERSRLEAQLHEAQEAYEEENRTTQSLQCQLQQSRAACAKLEEKAKALEEAHQEAIRKKDEAFAKEKRHLK